MSIKKSEAILQNEGTSKKKAPSLPSGTFTSGGNPTITLELIGLKVAEIKLFEGITLHEIFKKRMEIAVEIVDLLDSFKLLSNNVSREQKITKVGMQIAWMTTSQTKISSDQATQYSAAKIAYQKAKNSIRLANKN